MKPEPITSLTTIRGYLACWVLLYHLSKELFLLLPATVVLAPAIEAGHLAVPGFFVLSGYVLWINYESWFSDFQFQRTYRFLLHRFARLYPVHIVTLLATLAMVIGGSVSGIEFPKNLYSPGYFFRNLLLIHTWVPHFHFNWNYPSWSISSEWFAYLCFPSICLLLHQIKETKAAFAAASVSALTIVLFAMFGKGLLFREMLLVVPLFSMGCCLGLLLGHRASPVHRSYVPECILLGVFCAPFLVGVNRLQIVEHLLLAGLVGSLGWIKSSASIVWTNRLGKWIGDISYSLYMCHFLVIKVANQLVPLHSLSQSSFSMRFLTFVSYLIVIFGLSWTTYIVVERPCQRFFRTRRAKTGVDSLSQVQPSGVA